MLASMAGMARIPWVLASAAVLAGCVGAHGVAECAPPDRPCRAGEVCRSGRCVSRAPDTGVARDAGPAETGPCPGECAPGATETEPCARCGTRSRECSAGCAWGGFGECMGQGACEPGETTSRSCAGCASGAQPHACDDECSWQPSGPCLDVSLVEVRSAADDRTSYTFSGVALGPAAPGKRAVIAAIGRHDVDTTSEIVGLTVDGRAATLIAADAATWNALRFYVIDASDLASASIQVTFDSPVQRAAIAVWSVVGLGGDAPHATAFADTTESPPLAVAVPCGGVVFGVHMRPNGPGTCSWTGLGRDFAIDIDDPGQWTTSFSGAHRRFDAGATASVGWSCGGPGLALLVSLGP